MINRINNSNSLRSVLTTNSQLELLVQHKLGHFMQSIRKSYGDNATKNIVDYINVNNKTNEIASEFEKIFKIVEASRKRNKTKPGSKNKEKFGRLWSCNFGFLSQAKNASGFALESFNGRSAHDWNYDNAPEW